VSQSTHIARIPNASLLSSISAKFFEEEDADRGGVFFHAPEAKREAHGKIGNPLKKIKKYTSVP
jgi:hypothetical protein